MAGKANGSNLDDWARAPPKINSFWKRFGNVFYNPEENSFFGRTPRRWGIILVFYAIFYAVLAALFAVCMAALFYTIDEKKPTFTLGKSLIGENPGVSFRPIPHDGVQVSYHLVNESETEAYVHELQDFITTYKREPWFLEKSSQGCTAADRFGFPYSPCFFIKVNKIYGWVPELYDAANLPEDMSEDLKDHIKALPAEEQKQVWISCWEEHKESSNDTQFEYPWGRGLAASYFPYINTRGHMNPLVAVKITPPVQHTVVIRCRAWARNIIYDKSIKEASGYARILIHVEGENATDTTEKNAM